MEGCFCLSLQNTKMNARTSSLSSYLVFGTLLMLASNACCGPTAARTSELLNHISNLKLPIEENAVFALDSNIKSSKLHPREVRSAESSTYESPLWRNGSVCRNKKGRITIRIGNQVSDLKVLENCSVIEGNLQIIWMSRFVTPANYSNIRFPKLLEITGYLLFYRVNGLTSIGQLFPNLRVIRAEYDFYEYGLILFQNEDLESVSLPKLGYVGNNVIAMLNPRLCYIDDHVNWRTILRTGQPPVTTNNRVKENGCELIDGCPEGCNNCWDMDVCQIECRTNCILNAGTDEQHNPGCDDQGFCCHKECLGGCESPGSPAMCYACRNVNHEGECMDKCPDGRLEFDGRRCLSEEECIRQNKENKFHDGKCILECPNGWIDHKNLTITPDDHSVHKCIKCEGICDKVCRGGTIQTTGGSDRFSGCTFIDGFLEIAISNSAGNVTQLDENLNLIREVTNYIKVVRSPYLQNLNFFRNLRRIRGKKRDKAGQYSFYVMDNENLETLWDMEPGKKIIVDEGRMFFQQNPRLCYTGISKFLDSSIFHGTMTTREGGVDVNITKASHDEFDVSESTNGRYGNCYNNSLFMELKYNTFSYFPTYNFSGYNASDDRTIIGYVLYYREVKIGEVANYYRSSAECGRSGSTWQTIEIDKSEYKDQFNGVYYYNDIILRMAPYTRYAAYIQTFTTRAVGMDGAKSEIVYLRTNPAKPLRPTNIVVTPYNLADNIALYVTWEPPEEPNGIIEKYNVYYRKLPWNTDLIYRKSFCRDESNGPKIGPKPTVEATEAPSTKDSNNSTESCSCEQNTAEDSKPSSQRVRLAKLRRNFENNLQNDIFSKNPSILLTRRRRREVNDDDAAADFELPLVEKETESNVSLANLTTLPTTTTTTEKPSPKSESIVPSMVSVLANRTSVPIFNLEPNMEYSIEVVACHAYDKEENATRCSKRAISNALTKPNKSLDVIDSPTFRVQLVMEHEDTVGLNFTWAPPKDTNGPILSYTISYRVVDETPAPLGDGEDAAAAASDQIDHSVTTLCVDAHNFTLSNNSHVWRTNILKGGTKYEFRVRMRTVGTVAGNYTRPFTLTIPSVPSADANQLVIAIVLPVCLVFGALAIAATVMSYRYRRRKPLPFSTNQNSFNPDYVDAEYMYTQDEWEVERSKVKVGVSLGQGSFGMVYEGTAKDLPFTDGTGRKVAIKTVNDTATHQDRMNFLNEASRMKEFRCHHIVQLLGVVSEGQPVLVIMELMVLGDLKNYLRMHRPDEPDNDGRRPPTLREILQMAAEIADGMAYLSDRKFVHRDLAARNCMVAHDMTVKIGDFGMTRDIYDADYYRKGGKGMLPVRWMAPESLRDGVYTSKSDVWSYGVVLWEMATLAAQPYQGFCNEEVLKFVVDNRVMEMPDGCPTRLYTMMTDCWQYFPRYRPTFASLLQSLQGDVKKSFFGVAWYYSEREDEAEASENEADSLIINQISEAQPLHPGSMRSSGQHLDDDNRDEDMDVEDEDSDSDDDDLEDTPIKELVIDLPPPIPARPNSYRSLPRLGGGEGVDYQMMREPLVNGHNITSSDSEETDDSSSTCGSPLLHNGGGVTANCIKSHSGPPSSIASSGLPPPSYNAALDQPIAPTDPSIWSTENNSKSNSCNGSANGHIHYGNTLTSAC